METSKVSKPASGCGVKKGATAPKKKSSAKKGW